MDDDDVRTGIAPTLVMPPEGHVLLLHADMEVDQLEHKREQPPRP